MLRVPITLLILSGAVLARDPITPDMLPDLIDLQRSLSTGQKNPSVSPQLFPDLITPQLEKTLQDLVDKNKEDSEELSNKKNNEKDESPSSISKKEELLVHSDALEELEAHVKKLRGLKPAQKASLLSLIQTLDERPDDAFITLKAMRISGEPNPWLQLQELYLSESLGLEEETRDLGEKLRGRWFPEQLLIPKVEFCRSVQTFGNFEPMGDVLESGKHTLIYIELTGLTQEVETDGYRRSYQVSFDVLADGTEGSDLSQPPQSFEDFSRSRRGESYVWIKWKAMLTPGPYRMVVNVEDHISGQSLKREKPFTIR